MAEHPLIMQLRQQGASIGVNVFFGPDVYIEADFASLLTIEDGVVLARGVSILLHDSSLNNILGTPVKFGRVTLRRNCYIGANTTILCGVEIGERALVGAASLVTHDIPADMLAYGHPARIAGTVQELAARQQQDLRPQVRYLDIQPWRERQQTGTEQDTMAQLQALLLSLRNGVD
jgi:acetyltransferase-like isoleucine patch superfamily enzyme